MTSLVLNNWALMSYFATKIFVTEAHLMSTHNFCFYGEIRKIIPELSPNTPPQQFLRLEHWQWINI